MSFRLTGSRMEVMPGQLMESRFRVSTPWGMTTPPVLPPGYWISVFISLVYRAPFWEV